MYRIRILKPRYVLGFLPFGLAENEYDITKEYVDSRPSDQGFDRVKRIFYKQPDGNISPELQSFVNSTGIAFVCGGLIGGILAMGSTPEKFAYENMGTKFESHFAAAKAMQNKIMVTFYQGALHIGWRTALFFSIFQSTTTMLYAYEGKTRISHYVLGGGLSGMLFKVHSGLYPAISGTVFGSLLGLIAGGAIHALLYMSGMTLTDIYEMKQRSFNEQRKEQLKQVPLDEKQIKAKNIHEALAELKK